MARKRTDFGPELEAQIEARTARGESAETVAAALGMPAQVRTIRRRQAELRGRAPAKSVQRAATTAPPSPPAVPVAPAGSGEANADDVPDEPPEGTPLEQIDRWIKRLEHGLAVAEANGNLAAIASLAQKVGTLMALRHRVAPLPKADPNERPDYLELAKVGEERLLTLIRGSFKYDGVTSP